MTKRRQRDVPHPLFLCWGVVALLAAPFPLQAGAREPFATGQLVEGVTCRSDSTQSYTLYLPSGYDSARRWPALLVFDPRGRSILASELFRDAAEKYDWIVLCSNDTRSDGPWEPNARAMQALWPEVHFRFSVDPRRIYAAGFSGGVLVAWYLAQFANPPALAGILASGGRRAEEIPVDRIAFAHFGAAGDIDFNFSEMKRLDALVAERGAPHRFEVFEDGHRWMPPELALEGVEWMEMLAMRQGLREKDPGTIEAIYRKNLDAARALEGSGRVLEALRRHRMIARTWEGLHDLGEVESRIAALDGSRVVTAQLEAEHRAEDFESERVRRLSAVLQGYEAAGPPASSQLVLADLRIVDLQKRAAEDSPTGTAARRVLEWTFTRIAFYMKRDWFERGHHAQAAVLLEVATKIHPNAAQVWYDLARAYSRAGNSEQATSALHRALDEGFRDLAAMQAEADLQPIRSTTGYAQAAARLSPPPGSEPAAPR